LGKGTGGKVSRPNKQKETPTVPEQTLGTNGEGKRSTTTEGGGWGDTKAKERERITRKGGTESNPDKTRKDE